MTLWANTDQELAAVPGTVSAYVGPLDGPPAYTRLPDATHYGASTMKVAVLVALHRSGLDLDAPVTVHNAHHSALPGGAVFGNDPVDDSDTLTWARIGGTASLRWLAERMIVRSGNLATNLCIEAVGLPAVAEVWRDAGARHSVTDRGIEDLAARDAGLENLVTAADLAALFGAGRAPSTPRCFRCWRPSSSATTWRRGCHRAPGWRTRAGGSPGYGTAPGSCSRPTRRRTPWSSAPRPALPTTPRAGWWRASRRPPGPRATNWLPVSRLRRCRTPAHSSPPSWRSPPAASSPPAPAAISACGSPSRC